MKYVLNKKKGTIINHPTLGKLEGGVAYCVSDEQANMVKDIINIHIFDRVEEHETNN